MIRKNKIIINFMYLIILILAAAGCSNNNESEKIDYQTLFKGFVTLNDISQPSGATECLIFASEENWIDFCDKYFSSFFSAITEINNRAIDFQKENLVFIYSLGPRHSYDSFVDIKYLIKEGNAFTVEFDSKKEVKDTIYVLNNVVSEDYHTKHALVFLLSVKSEDVPENPSNLYVKE